MSQKTRWCQRCKAEIPAERIEALPQTRFCTECSKFVEEKYGGEFRQSVHEKKQQKQGSLKTTGVDYEVKVVRNKKVPWRFDEKE